MESKHFNNLIKKLGEEFKQQNSSFVNEEQKIEIIAEKLDVPNEIAKYLSDKITESSDDSKRWDDPIKQTGNSYVTAKDMNEHYNILLKRLQQQLSTLGGGGEVKFLRLDDVSYGTAADGKLLEYDAVSKKVQFTSDIGLINTISFDTTQTGNVVDGPGILYWDAYDDTLNLNHPNGVTQQMGQELYAYVRNRTGSTITNGTAVRFSGAEENGISRLLVTPFLADGTYPSLYGVGIATENILDGADGYITVWGKVRNLNTSAWSVGDILYVNPTNVGQLTAVKPTAPNNVIPMAVVLKSHLTDGEIFVRPTIEQHKHYGRFLKTVNQTADVINTPYTIEFDTTQITNGVLIDTPPSRISVPDSGLYQFDISLQIAATSNKGVVYLWFRKNGVDIPLSSRSTTVTNGDVFSLRSSIQISLNANEYVEAVWAASATGILLESNASPAVGPSVASAFLTVGQIQL